MATPEAVIQALIKAGQDPQKLKEKIQSVPPEQRPELFKSLSEGLKLEIIPGVSFNVPVAAGDGGQLTGVEAFRRGVVGGAAFGAGSLLPGVKKREAEAFEDFPVETIAGEFFGGAVGLPALASRALSGIFRLGPAAFRGARLSKKAMALGKEAPGIGREMLRGFAETPGLASEVLAATALTKMETGSTLGAGAAGAITGTMGLAMKAAGHVLFSSPRRAIQDPQVLELVTAAVDDPKKYKQLVAAAFGDEASRGILMDSVKEAQRIVDIAANNSRRGMSVLGRKINSRFARFKRVLNEDFGAATKKFIAEKGDDVVDVSEALRTMRDILEGEGVLEGGALVKDAAKKLEAKGLDPTILDIYESLPSHADLDSVQPVFVAVSELMEARKIAKGASNFQKVTRNTDDRLNGIVFNEFKKIVDEQLPEYSQILENYSKSIRPLSKLERMHKISSAQGPNEKMNSLYRNRDKEFAIDEQFENFMRDATTSDNPELGKALQASMGQVQSTSKQVAMLSSALADLPKDSNALRKTFLSMDLAEIEHPYFSQLAKKDPVIREALKDVRVFKLATQFFVESEGLLDEAANILLRPKVGAAGATKKGVLRQVAAQNPDITLLANKIDNMFRGLGKESKSIVMQFFKGLLPSSGSVSRTLVQSATSAVELSKLKERFSRAQSYIDRVQERGLEIKEFGKDFIPETLNLGTEDEQ